MSMRGVTWILVAALMLIGTALPSSAAGRVRVVDGDTIHIGSEKYRLFGIDAPESGQKCIDIDLRTWDCGRVATEALRRIIGNRPPKCDNRGRDRYGRVLTECIMPGDHLSINERLVRGGAVWAYVRYSKKYVEAERKAKNERIGIWVAPNTPPWEWRKRRSK